SNAGDNQHFRKTDAGSRMTISNTSVSDTGVYSCMARLGNDTAAANAQLIVEDISRFPKRSMTKKGSTRPQWPESMRPQWPESMRSQWPE
ncbi:hypothetical protein LSAT2_002704, partial [Lamellibrachia satsuma]